MSGLHVDDALREIGRLQEDKRELLAALRKLQIAAVIYMTIDVEYDSYERLKNVVQETGTFIDKVDP